MNPSVPLFLSVSDKVLHYHFEEIWVIKVKQVVLLEEKRHDISEFNVIPSNRLIINKLKKNMTF